MNPILLAKRNAYLLSKASHECASKMFTNKMFLSDTTLPETRPSLQLSEETEQDVEIIPKNIPDTKEKVDESSATNRDLSGLTDLQVTIREEQNKIDEISRRKTQIFQAYNENRTLVSPFGNQQSNVVSLSYFPPTHFLYAFVAMILFCFPVGLYAVTNARKAQDAIERLDARAARRWSISAHRYATVAIYYGSAVYLILILILMCSPELATYLV